jgi:hypothetical protein
MKIIKDTVNRKGKRVVTVELDQGELIRSLRPLAYYKLGYPFEEVVQTHIVEDAYEVTWCPLGQEWVS